MHLAMQHGPTSIAAALRPRRRRLPGWLLAALLLSSNGAIGAPAFQDAPRSAAAAKTAAAGTHLVAAIVGIALGIGAAIAVGALVAQVRRRAAIADESSKAAARMLAFASHEIRNPVHGIAGLAELLERSPLDAEQRRIVATIRETAFGLGRLADDFLQHARLNLGQLPPRPAATSPAALVGSVLALERAAADRKRIRLESRVGDDVPAWVLVDAPRLRQVLLNLVGNAIRHSAAGEVSVRVAAVPGHGARLRFEVRDSGRGLGPAERERLFQPFAHDTETMRPPEAVGIGLSISKQLVESVGGVIGIDPQTVRGSCFWFEVDAPACIEPDPEGAAPASHCHRSGPTSSMTTRSASRSRWPSSPTSVSRRAARTTRSRSPRRWVGTAATSCCSTTRCRGSTACRWRAACGIPGIRRRDRAC